MERIYSLASVSVVHEVIDGEAIIMDMRTGSYYSTDGIGALIWSAALANAAHGQILEAAERAFPDADAAGETARFLDSLFGAGLLQAEARSCTTAMAPDFTIAGAWRTPELSSHQDMQDLLLLDPIHEVGATGWPMPKDAVAGAEPENA